MEIYFRPATLAAKSKLGAWLLAIASFFLIGLATALFSTQGAAQVYQLQPEQSVFAMLTHKGGIARALAHDHIVVPSPYSAHIAGELERDAAGQLLVREASFKLVFAAAALHPDLPDVQARWWPQVQAAGLMENAYPDVSVADREKIKATALSAEQLDAATYPEVEAELSGLKPEVTTRGQVHFTHQAQVTLKLHGHEVTRPFAVRIAQSGQHGEVLTLEGAGRYRFSDFGIKPFAALGGAIRNEDEFDIYVHFVAKSS